jgi:hypothetical protein
MGTFKACASFAMVLGVAGMAPSFEIGEIALTNTFVDMYVALCSPHPIHYIKQFGRLSCRPLPDCPGGIRVGACGLDEFGL